MITYAKRKQSPIKTLSLPQWLAILAEVVIERPLTMIIMSISRRSLPDGKAR